MSVFDDVGDVFEVFIDIAARRCATRTRATNIGCIGFIL